MSVSEVCLVPPRRGYRKEIAFSRLEDEVTEKSAREEKESTARARAELDTERRKFEEAKEKLEADMRLEVRAR